MLEGNKPRDFLRRALVGALIGAVACFFYFFLVCNVFLPSFLGADAFVVIKRNAEQDILGQRAVKKLRALAQQLEQSKAEREAVSAEVEKLRAQNQQLEQSKAEQDALAQRTAKTLRALTQEL